MTLFRCFRTVAIVPARVLRARFHGRKSTQLAEVMRGRDEPKRKAVGKMLTPQRPCQPGSPFTPICPVCGARTSQVYDRNERRIFACGQCQTDVIVPMTAWAIASERKPTKT